MMLLFSFLPLKLRLNTPIKCHIPFYSFHDCFTCMWTANVVWSITVVSKTPQTIIFLEFLEHFLVKQIKEIECHYFHSFVQKGKEEEMKIFQDYWGENWIRSWHWMLFSYSHPNLLPTIQTMGASLDNINFTVISFSI